MPLSDRRIAALIDEPKPLVEVSDALGGLGKAKRSNRKSTTTVTGSAGTRFHLHLRQNTIRAFDFSVILTVESGGVEIILRRHNGRGHTHPNKLEGNELRNVFHIHMATQRYQDAGYDIDAYAEPTDAFHDLATALRAMLEAANFAPVTELDIYSL